MVQNLEPDPKKIVDLVVYDLDGNRKVIGECEIKDDDLDKPTIGDVKITDPEIRKKFLDAVMPEGSMSIGTAGKSEVDFSTFLSEEKPNLIPDVLHKNVFDPKKKD